MVLNSKEGMLWQVRRAEIEVRQVKWLGHFHALVVKMDGNISPWFQMVFCKESCISTEQDTCKMFVLYFKKLHDLFNEIHL